MNFFDHPFWPLLTFGFVVAPRVLLFSLWLGVKDSLSNVITFPILSYFGFAFAPRLTLACIMSGFFWKENAVLCVLAFAFSFVGESGEKVFIRRKFRNGFSGFKFPKIHIHIDSRKHENNG